MAEREIIKLADQYNNTNKFIIKQNLMHYISDSQYDKDSQKLANIIGVSREAIYSYRKLTGNVPEFITACKLVNALGINIEDLITEYVKK